MSPGSEFWCKQTEYVKYRCFGTKLESEKQTQGCRKLGVLIPALGRQRQQTPGFRASLGYMANTLFETDEQTKTEISHVRGNTLSRPMIGKVNTGLSTAPPLLEKRSPIPRPILKP